MEGRSMSRKLTRVLAGFCLAVMSSFGAVPPGSAGTGGSGELLMRVERIDRHDLATLRSRGIPVVMELRSCLIVRGSGEDLARLEQLGRQPRILDEASSNTSYAMVGLRPDSDRALLRASASVIWREENWWLVRLDPGTSLASLAPARVFLTPLPDAPIDAPRAPGRRPAPPAADFADPDPVIQKLVEAVDETEIDRYFQDLTDNPPTGTRFSQSQGCRDAAEYCHDAYTGLDLLADYQEWSTEDAPNVVGEIPGALRPEDIYLVLGHLDDLPASGPAPGADDNASGSVAVLESARVMSCWAHRNTVRFLNVTGEEQGLNGSHAYAQRSKDLDENILGAINHDMIAWEGDGLPSPENLDLNYNGPSEWLGRLFADSADLYDTGLAVDAFYCPSLTASDHYAFWSRGYDAVCGITDNEGYCGHGGNYPYYHQSDDTIANCGDLGFFYDVVRTSVAALAELSEPFKITFDEVAHGCAGTAEVVVGDRDLNSDPSSEQTIDVEVWSDSETTPEILTLTERGADSMLFDGSIPLSTAPPASGDGVVGIREGDQIFADYVDALDCDDATDVAYRAVSVVDCSAPVVSNVHETDVSDIAATIRWDTDEASDSTVVWGESTPPDITESREERSAEHAVDLEGLQECTVYYYEVRSTDPAGNTAVANNGGQYYHFETLGDFGDGLQPCHEGRVTVDDPVYSCADSVRVTLVDLDLNVDADAVDVARVVVSSSTEATAEPTELTETGPNTSRFTGSLPTGDGEPEPDGVLQLAHGDTITATYKDEDDGSGGPSTSFDTAEADCAGPVIRALRVEPLEGPRATVRFETDEPGDSGLEWGFTPSLGRELASAELVTDHALVINDFDLCAEVYLQVRSTDEHGHTSTLSGPSGPFRLQASDVPGLYWRASFEESEPGWTLEGEWEVGDPQGMGGSSGVPDPVDAYANARLLGHDLSGAGSFAGDYEPSTQQSAWSPELDATTWTDTRLLLYRRLSAGAGDEASLWLWAGPGRALYRSEGEPVEDGSFQPMGFDIAPLADGVPALQLELRQKADASGQYAGWNVDEVIFKSGALPDYGPCGGCAVPPAFAGASGAQDDDACAASGVTVSWERAAAWGSGGAGSYAVYRGDVEGFTPGPDTLVASGVTELSYTDLGAPTDRAIFYLVRAENDETCGAGPDHGGLTDGNAVYAAAEESTGAELPGVVPGLRVRRVAGDAHIRLRWTSSESAASYRVLRSPTPAPSDFGAIGETPDRVYDDVGAGADRETYFYLVRGLNPCGQAGP
jgi:hypothetical protein